MIFRARHKLFYGWSDGEIMVTVFQSMDRLCVGRFSRCDSGGAGI